MILHTNTDNALTLTYFCHICWTCSRSIWKLLVMIMLCTPSLNVDIHECLGSCQQLWLGVKKGYIFWRTLGHKIFEGSQGVQTDFGIFYIKGIYWRILGGSLQPPISAFPLSAPCGWNRLLLTQFRWSPA